MKKILYFFFPALLVSLLVSCSGPAVEKDKLIQNVVDSIKKIEAIQSKEAHKFDPYSRIEIVSFKAEDWQNFKMGNDSSGRARSKYNADQNYLDAIRMVDRIELSPGDRKELGMFCSTDNLKPCSESWDKAKCYQPRHAIIFYEGKKRTAYFEVCFHCHQFRNNTPFNFCQTNISIYREFFKKTGITYFGEI
jgi:hypothetical protein